MWSNCGNTIQNFCVIYSNCILYLWFGFFFFEWFAKVILILMAEVTNLDEGKKYKHLTSSKWISCVHFDPDLSFWAEFRSTYMTAVFSLKKRCFLSGTSQAWQLSLSSCSVSSQEILKGHLCLPAQPLSTCNFIYYQNQLVGTGSLSVLWADMSILV